MTTIRQWKPVPILFEIGVLGSALHWLWLAPRGPWAAAATDLYYPPIPVRRPNLGSRAAVGTAVGSSLVYFAVFATGGGDAWLRLFSQAGFAQTQPA